jgi:hypothetical protein
MDFCFIHKAYNGSWAHSGSSIMVPAAVSPRGETAGREADRLPASIANVKNDGTPILDMSS